MLALCSSCVLLRGRIRGPVKLGVGKRETRERDRERGGEGGKEDACVCLCAT